MKTTKLIHLYVVVHGEVAHGLSVGVPVLGVLLERPESVPRVFLHHFVQHDDVLHALEGFACG